jgi:RsiW-degrading membrane proteinase PrsW (M82 family)
VTPIDPARPGHLSVGFIIGIAACSLVALVALAAIAAGGAVSAGIGLTLALLPIPALLAGVLYLDRLEPEPPGSLVFVFLWGAGAAALLGLIGIVAGTQLLTTPTLRLDGFATETAAATIGVAVLEETLKGAVLIVLLRRLPHELDGTSDGVVYGSMVGLGFALIENIFYYTQAAHHGFSGVAATFLLRGIVSPLCQALFTSLIGIGVAYAAMSPRGRGLWAIGVGWIAAVTLHALWNVALSSSLARLAIFYAFMVVVFAAVLVAVIIDRRRIVALLHRYLPQYEPTGVITGHDIAMLGSLLDRRQARQWARLHAGLAGLREMAEYQLAATELGLLHRRSERDLVDGDAFAQRRDGLLAGMRASTMIVLARLDGRPRPPWAAHGTSCFRPARVPPQRPASDAAAPPGSPAEP